MHLNEFEIANKIKDGDLPSPFKYSNMWLVNIRITGTGMAYRSGLNEHVWRDPAIYLNENFLKRINGLPVIRDHPDKSLLNDDEFKNRILGTVMLPYIKDEEVWAVVRIYSNEIIKEILDGTVSTSPAVSFNDSSGNILIDDKESHLLIEGKPALVDHIALVTKEHGSIGVWDKNQIPEGVEISNKKGTEMEKEELKAMLEAFAGSLGTKVDAFNEQVTSRFDAVEQKMSNFEIRLDAAKKDEHIEEDKTKHKEIMKEIKEVKGRSDADENESLKKEIAELKSRLDKKDNRKDENDAEKKERKDSTEEEKSKREDRKDESKEHEMERDKEKENDKRKDRKDEAGNDNRFSWTAEDKDEDERKDSAMIDARVKADSAFSACGKTAPRPFDGESSIAYRKRALAAMQKYSPEYKDVKIKDIADSATLAMAEKTIYADAAQAIQLKRQNTPGHLFEVIKTDAANRQIRTFEGDPDTWMSAFKQQPRKVVKFNTSGRMTA
ncbi:NUDIX hydrolase [Arsenophonus nasoniae]|uniref:Conserved hypothetical phage protein n=1 Tax=Arsenophonus nasoniae TaxID=638 RepID=D2TYL1_9GAMM|nr:cell envelope integrity protein TolA [Arsenophonus nasoniae]QBY43983.1 hypothetical protein ArsFIN_25560 [Arsenophonus nasoniae]WGM04300.1 NUDIX hydrolase [Arsenophonus nasoniae]WGM09403.1 NUDIX hydrolase [Arsenophonus nasoniae]WGM14127.1 NUDIX hydrolase [Arsenophonus nasoniae]CBA72507.1 conserved hypothetical phage protein [Arsenophonus nasoniae]